MLAASGTSPYSWAATGLPAGLSMNTLTGVISGTPTTVGSSSVTVTLTDAAGATDVNPYTLVDQHGPHDLDRVARAVDGQPPVSGVRRGDRGFDPVLVVGVGAARGTDDRREHGWHHGHRDDGGGGRRFRSPSPMPPTGATPTRSR